MSVSDNFNRADGPIGNNWFGPDGLNPPNIDIVTLRAHGTNAAQNRAVWGAPTGLAGTDLSSGGSQCGVIMRFRGTTNAAAIIQLEINHTTDLGQSSFRLRLVAGVWTASIAGLGSVVIPAPVNGDVLMLRQNADVGKGYINGVLITSFGGFDQDALVHPGFKLALDVFADNWSYFTSQDVIL